MSSLRRSNRLAEINRAACRKAISAQLRLKKQLALLKSQMAPLVSADEAHWAEYMEHLRACSPYHPWEKTADAAILARMWAEWHVKDRLHTRTTYRALKPLRALEAKLKAEHAAATKVIAFTDAHYA
jgi:hypothetical protein